MKRRQVITVIKQTPDGQDVWRYDGWVLNRQENRIQLEAFFDRHDMNMAGLWLRRGDRFVETYYRDRWYNIFAVYKGAKGALKGWYCNIATPATWDESMLRYRDLALDLLVFPDGQQKVLDEEEFAALDIPATWRQQAQRALADLRARFATGEIISWL